MNRVQLNAGVPLYVYQDGDNLDDIQEPIAFVVSKEGILIKRANKYYTGYQKVQGIDLLGKVENDQQKAQYNFPKLSYQVFEEIKSFFQYIYDRDQTEATILLYHNEETGEWTGIAPTQENSGGGSDYKIDDKTKEHIPEGFKLMGSIHSHAGMGAFHSGTDDNDEFNFDGLHITLGNFNSNVSNSCRYIFGGEAIKVELGDVLDEVPEQENKFPEWWSKQASKKTYTAVQSGYFHGRQYAGWNGHYPNNNFGNPSVKKNEAIRLLPGY